MTAIVIYVILVIFGLCLGSFAGASVWRLRARQLKRDKADGEHIDLSEYKRLNKLTKSKIVNDRSQCLHCLYKLRWYDLIPVYSWITLGGKCRKCHQPIGLMEPLIEIGVMVFFVMSYVLWPYQLDNGFEVTRLVLWLSAGVSLAILFAYDAKWSLLPDKANFALIGTGLINALIIVLGANDKMTAFLEIIYSGLILSGFYLVLYLISKGKWIGFGDIKLGLGLALLLADWKLAFIALFAANLIGCLIVIPAMIAGKLKRDSHVPFGPLLIAGFIVAGLAGSYLVNIFFYSLL